MDFLEIIKVQMSPSSPPADEMIRQAVTDIAHQDLTSYKVLRNPSVANELMVMLIWKFDRPQPWGSPLAQGLVQEFSRLGLVDYSIWTETPPGNNGQPPANDFSPD